MSGNAGRSTRSKVCQIPSEPAGVPAGAVLLTKFGAMSSAKAPRSPRSMTSRLKRRTAALFVAVTLAALVSRFVCIFQLQSELSARATVRGAMLECSNERAIAQNWDGSCHARDDREAAG